MSVDLVIRHAREDDVPSMNAIYNEYIVDSHVSFDTEAWSEEKRFKWFRSRVEAGYPAFVACKGEDVIGVSWSGPWIAKKGYLRSVETTIVLTGGEEGRGVGTELHSVLIEALKSAGFHRAYANIALPNDPSIAMLSKLGYREVGVLDEAGFKDGRYISTILMELSLDS